MPREIVLRHRPTHFLHVYSSDSYSAGYYSYLWADTLSADAWEAFVEAGNPFDQEGREPRRPAAQERHVRRATRWTRPSRTGPSGAGTRTSAHSMRKRGFPAPAPAGEADAANLR
jgi:peptidyl-dipeptidase Dcp